MTISSAYIFGKQLTPGQVPDPIGDFINMVADAQTEADFAAQLYVRVVPSDQLGSESADGTYKRYISSYYNDTYGCIPVGDRMSYIALIENEWDMYGNTLYCLSQTINGNGKNQLYTEDKGYRNGVHESTAQGGYSIYTRNVSISGATYFKINYETNVPRYEDLPKCETHINLMKAYWASRTAENLAALKNHMDAYATFSTDFS